MVHYQADTIRVGFDAKREAALDPHNTIVSVKRMMGKALADIDTRQQPYRIRGGRDGHAQLQTRQGLVNPVQVSAEILKNWPSAVPRPSGRPRRRGHHGARLF